MRKIVLVLVLASAACSKAHRLPKTSNGAPLVEVRGAVKDGPFALGRADLDRLPRRGVRGVNPNDGRTALWEGTPVVELVSARVELRKGSDTVIVRTADRSAVPIPLTVIRQFRPVLADRADGDRLAGAVLAWPTIEQRGIETDPRARLWWARDVVAFEVAEWQRMFGPALAPPDGSGDLARRGSAWFSERCVSCHRLRGVGGERGPDLTGVAARLAEPAFGAKLPNHPGWHASGFDEPSESVAGELWAFLRAVASAPAVTPEPPAPERGDSRAQ